MPTTHDERRAAIAARHAKLKSAQRYTVNGGDAMTDAHAMPWATGELLDRDDALDAAELDAVALEAACRTDEWRRVLRETAVACEDESAAAKTLDDSGGYHAGRAVAYGQVAWKARQALAELDAVLRAARAEG
jgi:hypothetical protein